MTLELCAQIANGNKTQTHLKSLRIKDGFVYATDLVNTIKASAPLLAGVDCFVSSEEFMQAWTSTKQPRIEQLEGSLRISEGKFKSELMLFDKDRFPSAVEDAPTGTSVDPKDFIKAIERVRPFLKVSFGLHTPQAYIVDGHINVTDNVFVIRTSTEAEFPNQDDKPLTISAQFAELISKIKKVPVDIVVNENTIAVVYEDGWIKTTRYATTLPCDFKAFFDERVTPAEKVEIPTDIVNNLRSICSAADKEDRVSFSSQGISLMKAGKAHYHIDYPMPGMSIPAQSLKVLLDNGKTFNFDNPKHVIFSGDDVEGVWSTMAVAEVES